ncbi:MAG TPA: MazG-like family protein [Candidatus Binatia bacterium]|nr:MazG-like family protein [Candidatus Binatia bacterium]
MTETQLTICTWADATFGPASDASIAARALEEMSKLVTACVNGEPAERIGEEIADVVIALARLGRALGVDVVSHVDETVAAPDRRLIALHDATNANGSLASVLTAVVRGDFETAAAGLKNCVWFLVDLGINLDLPDAIDRKMAINRTRRWVTDGKGHGRHVKEAP